MAVQCWRIGYEKRMMVLSNILQVYLIPDFIWAASISCCFLSF